MENGIEIKKYLGKQLSDKDENAKALDAATQLLADILGVLFGSGCAGFFFGYALSSLWAMINGI